MGGNFQFSPVKEGVIQGECVKRKLVTGKADKEWMWVREGILLILS